VTLQDIGIAIAALASSVTALNTIKGLLRDRRNLHVVCLVAGPSRPGDIVVPSVQVTVSNRGKRLQILRAAYALSSGKFGLVLNAHRDPLWLETGEGLADHETLDELVDRICAKVPGQDRASAIDAVPGLWLVVEDGEGHTYEAKATEQPRGMLEAWRRGALERIGKT